MSDGWSWESSDEQGWKKSDAAVAASSWQGWTESDGWKGWKKWDGIQTQKAFHKSP